jgi:(p)ppGpp synthase/HD superfamily hydrolase
VYFPIFPLALSKPKAQNIKMIDKAIAMALKAHTGQLDKAGQPYILHCLRVASKFTGHKVMYCAAVLHDTVEDSPITIADIHREFGVDVCEIVDSLTHLKREPYLEKYIPRCARDRFARVIKIADIYDNLDPSRARILADEDYRRIRKYHQALDILRSY